MSEVALDYPPLPVGGVRRLGVGWWGVLCVLLTEGALFGYLLFSYGYYAVQLDPGWMPAGKPSLWLAAPNTLVLILSSVAVWWGERGVRQGRRAQLLIGIAVGVLLGAAFIAIQLLEWRGQAFSLRSGLYGSLFFTITGFHMAHVAVGVLALAIVLLWSALGYFDRRRNAPVLIVSIYWHFVDAVWIAVFATLYLYLVPAMSAMSATQSRDPSPHRHRVGPVALAFGLGGGPLAWALQFIVNYAMASHACFPGFAPRARPAEGWDGVADVMFAINVVALAVALAAFVVASRSWRATRDEHRGGSRHLLDAGEGRSRFLAACGMMAAAGFFVATIATTVMLIWVPPCAG